MVVTVRRRCPGSH